MISLRGVNKAYHTTAVPVPVLHNVSLDVDAGEFVAIMGASGSGKSTLLNLIGGLDTIDSGQYALDGQAMDTLDPDALAAVRARRIGFVFQGFNLINRMSALRNVEMPMIYTGVPRNERSTLAAANLASVGLADRADHLPGELSGGQQQRVAIARALVNDPAVIVADEPTGSLDTDTGHDIMQLFGKLNQSGKTIVMVTHENDVAAYASRIITLKDGEVQRPAS